MATNFFRTYVNDRSFIRGAARLLWASISTPMPAKISDVISLSQTPTTAQNDVQTINMTATGGTFTVSDSQGNTTAPIVATATAAAVATQVAALATVGTGNITGGGGPLPAAVTLTGSGALANTYIPTFTLNTAGLTGGTATLVHTTPGSAALNLYDAQPSWNDLGATKNGISIAINNAEETFDIDQQLGIIGSRPSSWTVTVSTSLAESTPERMQIAWMGSTITVDNTPASGAEQQIGFGAPNFYTQRRLAVLYQRPSGYIRAYLFRIAQRSPAESTLVHNKTGDQQSIPVAFNILADNSVTDVLSQFFIIRDQAIPGVDTLPGG